jgi:hypothetical protein
MTEEKFAWIASGDVVEGCNSPPVCPAYWGSPLQAQFHDGRSECEGVWTFKIREGHYGDVDLSGLLVSYAFNTASPFPPKEKNTPWKCIIFIDEKATPEQARALEKIYRECWQDMGDVIAVKRAKIEVKKELLDGGPAAKHTVHIEGVYDLVTRPFRTKDGGPRYINSLSGKIINIGRSEVNQFKDPSLPRGVWNKPGMSVTYYDFTINPQKCAWVL